MTHTRYIHISEDAPKDPYNNNQLESDILSELADALPNVQHYNLNVSSHRHESVYTGIAGTALLEYRLAELRIPAELLSVSPDALIPSADQRIANVLTERGMNRHARNAGRASFIETDVGLATLVLKRFPWTEQKVVREYWGTSQHLLHNVLGHIESEDRHISEDSCEVLYGRAGLLYALLSLRSTYSRGVHVDHLYREAVESIESLTSDETIDKVMHSIIRRGQYGAREYYQEVGGRKGIPLPPLMWAWHSKRYLGAAHGVAGILHMLLCCPANLLTKYINDIVATIHWLIACKDKSGNWPAKAPGSNEVEGDDAGNLIQWCHGAPGVIMLLATLLRRSKEAREFELASEFEEKVHAVISHGASIVYHYGFLRKGVGMCHGIAGSVFTLLAAADASKKPEQDKHLSRALHLAHLATRHREYTSEGNMRVPDHPWSLYEGMAGMCAAWGEIMSRMKAAGPRTCSGMPGYDDLA